MPRDIKEIIKKGVSRTEFIKKQEAKAVRRKPIKTRPVKIRGTLYALRNKRLAIREGALRKRQIIISYVKTTTGELKKYIVAPMSWRYRKLKVGMRKMLYAQDVKERHVKSFALKNIRNVAITDRKFPVLQYPIEIT